MNNNVLLTLMTELVRQGRMDKFEAKAIPKKGLKNLLFCEMKWQIYVNVLVLKILRWQRKNYKYMLSKYMLTSSKSALFIAFWLDPCRNNLMGV